MASPIRIRQFDQVAAFLDRAGGFLSRREAEHNLPLGLAGRLLDDPHAFGKQAAYLALAETDDAVVAVAIRTPPHNLILSEVDDDRAVAAFVADLRATPLPGVLGPLEASRRFAELWSEETGLPARIQIAQRIYRASEAVLPEGVPGRYRAYDDGDRDLVLGWLSAFAAESLPRGEPFAAEELLDRRLAEPGGGFVLWEDGAATSVSSFGGATPSGIRIGPVYTPPELRGRGYASALVAELTRRLIAGGRQFCFLFTDLANPTSNSIYQRVGYRPVTDVNLWVFEQS
ncbi:MAG TPA: GNAT family N-acetyltransferase [Gaiellaceae bacterium]|nr:GNAT family N-acetyltransferase [Gaiellaceae bacterium]